MQVVIWIEYDYLAEVAASAKLCTLLVADTLPATFILLYLIVNVRF